MDAMSRTHHESARDIPVYDDVDVLVCGGGPAGFCAAIAAARAGAKTLLIEQMNCMGGIAAAGGHNHICLYTAWDSHTRVVGGVPWEMVRRVEDDGFGVIRGGQADYELEGLKIALDRMATGADLKLLYYTQVADAIVADGRCVGAIIQNKSGRQAVYAKQVVDATGDADVAAAAGAPYEMGRAEDGACQPCSLMFTIGGVDWDRLCEFRKGDYTLKEVWKAAQDAGDMEPFQDQIMGFWHTPTRPDQLGINFTHIFGVDCTCADDWTSATIEGRRQVHHMIPVFRKYCPGMEQCYLISTPQLLGTRESRRIVGEVVLTDEDILTERPWDDSVCYGSFFIDVHNCTGPGMDAETYRPTAGFKYPIPYRCMVPQQIDNLLVAGRCISVTHRALGSTRVMPQCGALGEAAGIAAALSADAGCTTREVDVAQVQGKLRDVGAIFDEQGIAEAN